MRSDAPYNPLDKRNLGASVADALLSRDLIPLKKLDRFDGAGIYAIYYSGDFPAYQKIAVKDQDREHQIPIYVGKAVPPGARKGGFGLNTPTQYALYNRLREHADSVTQATNLKEGDFHCRYLVVEDIWIPLGESLLIAKFAPIWNNIVDGFGNHDPGKGRYEQWVSRWDTLHPGRPWAVKCKKRDETQAQIENEVAAHLASAKTPSDVSLFE